MGRAATLNSDQQSSFLDTTMLSCSTEHPDMKLPPSTRAALLPSGLCPLHPQHQPGDVHPSDQVNFLLRVHPAGLCTEVFLF